MSTNDKQLSNEPIICDEPRSNAYQHLFQLNMNTLARYLDQSMFSHQNVLDYYTNYDCDQELVFENKKDETIQKVIFGWQCYAHQMLQTLKVENTNCNKLLKKEKLKFENLTKWQLFIILDYYHCKYGSSFNKQRLVNIIELFLIEMKKENNNQYNLTLKKFINYIGDDVLNMTVDPDFHIIIDNDCHAWTAVQRRLILRIFRQCGTEATKGYHVPNVFEMEVPNSAFAVNERVSHPMSYEQLTVFFDTMKNGVLANPLRSAAAFRIACKVRRAPLANNVYDWITVSI